MAVEVALAMLQRDGHWLMQLRDRDPLNRRPRLLAAWMREG